MRNVYITLILLVVIIFNSIVYKKQIEHFASDISVQMRPCALYLINDPIFCDQNNILYEMGEIQLLVLKKKLKKTDKSIQLIKDLDAKIDQVLKNKSNLQLNTCKLSINNLKEIKSNTNSTDIYSNKTISTLTEFDTKNYQGYCFIDTEQKENTDVLRKISNDYPNVVSSEGILFDTPVIDTDSPSSSYAAVKIRNDLYIDTLMNDKKMLCKPVEDVRINDGEIFLKIHCHMENNNLFASKIDLVSYDKEKNMMRVFDKTVSEIEIQKASEDVLAAEFVVKAAKTTLEIAKASETADAVKSAKTTLENATKHLDKTKKVQENAKEFNKRISEHLKKFEDTFFTFTYIENKILSYTAISVNVRICTFKFNICDNVVSYAYISEQSKDGTDEKEEIKLSFKDEFRSGVILLKQSLQLPFSDKTKNISGNDEFRIADNKNNDISDLIDEKLKSLEGETSDLKMKLLEFDSLNKKIANNYKQSQNLCEMNESEYSDCIESTNIDFGNTHKLVEIIKKETENKLYKGNSLREVLIKIKADMLTTKITLLDVNEAIYHAIPKDSEGKPKAKGIKISFEKYADYVSNDNCVYLQYD